MSDFSKIRCDATERALAHRRLIERYLRERRPVSGGTGIAKAELGGSGLGSGLPGSGFLGPITQNSAAANVSFTPGNGIADNDWFLPNQNGASGTGPSFVESYTWKIGVGYMARSMICGRDQTHTSLSYASQSPTTFALTATDVGNAGIVSSLSPHENISLATTASGVQPTNPSSFQFRARASTFQLLTLNFLAGQTAQATNPQTLRIQCTLSDGSANPQNFSVTQTTGASQSWFLYKISFIGGSGGCDLIVRIFSNPADLSTFTSLGPLFAGAWY